MISKNWSKLELKPCQKNKNFVITSHTRISPGFLFEKHVCCELYIFILVIFCLTVYSATNISFTCVAKSLHVRKNSFQLCEPFPLLWRPPSIVTQYEINSTRPHMRSKEEAIDWHVPLMSNRTTWRGSHHLPSAPNGALTFLPRLNIAYLKHQRMLVLSLLK